MFCSVFCSVFSQETRKQGKLEGAYNWMYFFVYRRWGGGGLISGSLRYSLLLFHWFTCTISEPQVSVTAWRKNCQIHLEFSTHRFMSRTKEILRNMPKTDPSGSELGLLCSPDLSRRTFRVTCSERKSDTVNDLINVYKIFGIF